MPNPLPIKKLEQALVETIHRLPGMIGAEAVRFSKQRFIEQGWLGVGFVPWAKRKESKKSSGRGILTKTGRLRRSIRIVRITADSVVIGTDVPYAQAHNEGFKGPVYIKTHKRNQYAKSKQGTGVYSTKSRKERTRTVTSYSGAHWVQSHMRTMKIPKRQFLGDSPYLRKQVERMIAAELIRAGRRI